MIKNGSAPARLNARIRQDGRRILTRADILAMGRSLSHPDRAIARLVDEGKVDKIDRGLWLVPSGERPDFEVPRFWSNPELRDPLTISVLVVCNPTLRDVVRVLIAYGRKTVEAALAAAKSEGALQPSVEATANRMIGNAWKGIADVARHRIAA